MLLCSLLKNPVINLFTILQFTQDGAFPYKREELNLSIDRSACMNRHSLVQHDQFGYNISINKNTEKITLLNRHMPAHKKSNPFLLPVTLT
jgi:hypothetical protein